MAQPNAQLRFFAIADLDIQYKRDTSCSQSIVHAKSRGFGRSLRRNPAHDNFVKNRVDGAYLYCVSGVFFFSLFSSSLFLCSRK